MRLELDNITKVYGALKANDGISLAVEGGEIHGILGENGAGKSTLMKILAGFIPMTSGAIRVSGRTVSFDSPAAAAHAGIGMLYQDPLDFQQLEVIDNFMVRGGGRVGTHRSEQAARLRELCATFNFHLRPDARVRELTIGERQQLEMVRLLAIGVQVLILDEPTTGISSHQKALLFESLLRLKEEGKTILLVSHKLEDIEALCDRLTVLRRGKTAGTMSSPFDRAALLDWMFGSPAPALRPEAHAHGPELLRLSAVSCSGGRSGLSNCSLSVHAGEVIGLAGLEGSGQDLLLKVAAGLVRPTTGSVAVAGRDLTGRPYPDYASRGVAYLPSSRLEEALIPGLTIAEHALLLGGGTALRLDRAAAHAETGRRIREYRIKGLPETAVEELSGGNQQRLLLSQLPAGSRLLLLDNPTRGLDMESGQWVWQRLVEHARNGAAILFASPEIDEILAVAARVLVFFSGRLVLDVPAAEAVRGRLGQAIAGVAGGSPS